jgi:hypothetical protein
MVTHYRIENDYHRLAFRLQGRAFLKRYPSGGFTRLGGVKLFDNMSLTAGARLGLTKFLRRLALAV